ncbi:acetyl-CoA hydrolase/transferase family protein [Rhizosaccharibacter radicis]
MASQDRIANAALRAKIMPAEDAAALIGPGAVLGMSGFTGSGYPKMVPQALAGRIAEAHARGEAFKVDVLTGASTGPELDGALARVDGIRFRLPYQGDPILREKINTGAADYLDMHLSHVAPGADQGIYGAVDTAVIELSSIRADGTLVPSSSVGNSLTWIKRARQVILEVNEWHSAALDGMHDVYDGIRRPPHGEPIPLLRPDDRIGVPHLLCDPDRIAAIVLSEAPDRNAPFSEPDDTARAIAGHVLEFLRHEVKRGRLPSSLLPLQSGVGNVANAVLAGLLDGPFDNMTSFTEVIQDGMLDLLDSGKLRVASATAFSLSPRAAADINDRMEHFRSKIILRPQEVSNHPELIRRLGCITMNGLIEADIFGNVNSTQIMGSRIQNGIGGSGDFTRNAFLSMFVTPSVAKKGAISSIVPHAAHVDHITQDVQVIVTERGLADLRGLSPKQRAPVIIENCAHPDYKPVLQDYFRRACQSSYGMQSPTLLDEALGFHDRFVKHGSMLPR